MTSFSHKSKQKFINLCKYFDCSSCELIFFLQIKLCVIDSGYTYQSLKKLIHSAILANSMRSSNFCFFFIQLTFFVPFILRVTHSVNPLQFIVVLLIKFIYFLPLPLAIFTCCFSIYVYRAMDKHRQIVRLFVRSSNTNQMDTRRQNRIPVVLCKNAQDHGQIGNSCSLSHAMLSALVSILTDFALLRFIISSVLMHTL